MCEQDCTDHGTTVFVPPGHAILIYPVGDEPTIIRGSD